MEVKVREKEAPIGQESQFLLPPAGSSEIPATPWKRGSSLTPGETLGAKGLTA